MQKVKGSGRFVALNMQEVWGMLVFSFGYLDLLEVCTMVASYDASQLAQRMAELRRSSYNKIDFLIQATVPKKQTTSSSISDTLSLEVN